LGARDNAESRNKTDRTVNRFSSARRNATFKRLRQDPKHDSGASRIVSRLCSFQLPALVVTCALLHAARNVRADDRPPTLLDDSPAALAPKQARSEAEDDRLVAAARYAQGRILLRRGDRPAALRAFQRAWRYDPASLSIAAEIVPLAASLERREEAARYAVLAAEQRAVDAELMRQLGALLVQQNDFPRAIRMFESVKELEKDQPPQMASVSLRLEMGRLNFILGEFPKAAESFAYVRNALKAPGKFGLTKSQRDRLLAKAAVLYQVMGESFLLANRLDEAVEAFEQAHQAAPDEALRDFHLARVHAKQANWKAARNKLDAYLQADSSSAGQQPYELLKEVLAATSGDTERARDELLAKLAQLQEKDPANSDLAYFLAGQHLEAKQWANAESLYLDLLERRPTPAALQGLCQIYRRQGRSEKLLDILGRVVDEAGNLDSIGPQRAELANDTHLFAKLVEQTESKLESRPKAASQGILLALALLAVSADDPTTAERFAAEAAKLPGKSKRDVAETVGLSMYLAGQNESAARLLHEALQEKPDPPKAAAYQYYLAGALEMADQTEEALKAAREAARLQPDSVTVQARVPWVLFHARRYSDAEREYLKLLQAHDAHYDSSNVRDIVREARIVLSNICVIQDRIPEAVEWLEQVLDEFPENVAALNDLGYLWADQGVHLERALDMVQRAVAAEPENAAYRDSLGWALYRLQRYEEAVRELEKAASNEPPDGVILDHLGDAYWKTNRRAKALATWRQAVAVFRTQQELQYLKNTEEKLRRHGN
jgi:tetratricopeptide (TPR) repeat protein